MVFPAITQNNLIDFFFSDKTDLFALANSLHASVVFEDVLILFLKLAFTERQTFFCQLHACLVWWILLSHLACTLTLSIPHTLRPPVFAFLLFCVLSLPPPIHKSCLPLSPGPLSSLLISVQTHSHIHLHIYKVEARPACETTWVLVFLTLDYFTYYIVFSSFFHFPANFTFPPSQLQSHCV